MAKIASCAHFLKYQRGSPKQVSSGFSCPSEIVLRPAEHAPLSAEPRDIERPCPVVVEIGAQGTVTQLIGPSDSRKTDAAMALLLAAAEDGLACAWVEARAGASCPIRTAPAGWAWYRTGLYPAFALGSRTAPLLNVPSYRALPACVLWKERALPSALVRRRCMAAFHAAGKLLAQRRWAVVALHLGGTPSSAFREMLPRALAELRIAAGRSGTALLLLGDQPLFAFGGGIADGTVSRVCRVCFEPRRLRGPHGLRKRPEIGGRAAKRFQRGRQCVVSSSPSVPGTLSGSVPSTAPGALPVRKPFLLPPVPPTQDSDRRPSQPIAGPGPP